MERASADGRSSFLWDRPLMRPARSSVLLLALLLVNAAAPLCFRYFITIDGPVHVLRASLLEPPWSRVEHIAHGITYDTAGIQGSLGERILMLFLTLCSPERAHDLYAAFVSCATVLSAVAFSRVHGARISLATFWLAPVSLNILLFMGLFHFLMGVAIVFSSAAWWKWREASPVRRWAGLLAGAALAWNTHRVAIVILCVLLLPGFIIGWREQRGVAGLIKGRYRPWFLALAGMLLVAVAYRMWPVLPSNTYHAVSTTPMIAEANPLRPLFLLDPEEEKWLQGGIGALLTASFLAGLWARWRMGRNWLWHDTLLLGVFLFAMLGSMHRALSLPDLQIAERCRWLVFLFVATWLTAIASGNGGWTRQVIGTAALCALPLHLVRLVRVEAALSRLRPIHLAALRAVDALGTGGLVWPVITDTDPILQHLEAFVAIRHPGILIAPGEHVHLVLPREQRIRAGWLNTEDPAWMVRNWRKGIPPEVDQVLFMGRGIERTAGRHPWPRLLTERYPLSYDGDLARIYTALPLE